MSLLSVHNLSKGYGTHQVLNDVSLTLLPDQKVGLVGDNGSGKSTLARILAGVEVADTGTRMLRRDARVGYLAQVPALDPNKYALEIALEGLSAWSETRREFEAVNAQLAAFGDGANGQSSAELLRRQAELANHFEHLGGWEQEHRVHSLLEHLSVPNVHAPVGSLSGGEQRRVALAQLLVSEPDLLILDEPTNHLDTETIEWLENYLSRDFKRALLLVTHDRYFLDRIVTRTIELSHGVARSYDGGWADYLTAKAERQALEERSESNRQNFLRKEIEWLRRQPKARGGKQKARIDRAQSAIESGPLQARGSVKLETSTLRQGSMVLDLNDVSVDVAGRTLIDGLTFKVTKGQRIGIIGRNGAGKTTLLRVLTEQLHPRAGSLTLGKNTKIAYFDQGRSELDEKKTIAENVAGERDTVQLGEQTLTIYSYLERFLFRSDDIRKKVGMLSGGERARVGLAKLLLESSNLLLLDEPTNDLDVTTLGSLEELLTEFGGSVIVVSHDRYFLNRVATDLLVFEGEGRVVHYVGNYDTYLSLRPSPSEANASPRTSEAQTNASEPPAVSPQPKTNSGKRPPKLTFKEEQELATIEQRIEAAETLVAELQAQLSAPDFYRSGSGQVEQAKKALEEAEREVNEAMARWEELETKRQAFETFR
jgi:ATP-binding cassette subfamily F protein uup